MRLLTWLAAIARVCVLAVCLAAALSLPALAQTIRGSTPPGYSDFQVAFGESTTLVATFFYEAGLEWDRGGVTWTVYPNGAGPKDGITCANGPTQNITFYTASSSCSVVTNSTVGIFTVTATVWGGPVLTYQIRNYANVTLVTGPLPNGAPGALYSGAIPGQFGSQPLTYSVSAGALPPGIGLSSNGALSGRPTQVGTFNFTASVLDSGNIYGQRSTATAPFSITVNPPNLALSPATLPGGTVAAAYSQQLTGSGGVTPYQYTVSAGMLPPGLSLDATSGLLSGTATTGGTFNFTVRLGDSTTGIGAPFSTSQNYSIVVDKAATSLSLPAIAATEIGNTATFVASVMPAGATGTVSFWLNDVPQFDALVSGGTASFTTAALQPGTYTVKARYNGDSNYLASTISTPHTVSRGTAPVSITAPSGEVGPGELIGAQVAQGNATGQIIFELDGVPQSPGETLDGSAGASFTLPQLAPGQHSLVAAYSGDSTYVPARSAAVNFVIRRLNTPVAVIAPSGEVSPGDAIEAQTAQADATGQVTFELDGVPQSPAETLGGGGRASFTLPQLTPGQHTLLADYGGDSTYLSARSAVINFTIRRLVAPVNVIAPSGEVSPGDVIGMQMAQADATGQVVFELDGVPQSPAQTLDGSARAGFTLPQLAPGSHTLVAAYGGDNVYVPARSAATSFVIRRLIAPVSLVPPMGEVGTGDVITAQMLQPDSTGQITFELDGVAQSPAQTLDGNGSARFTLPQLAPGSHTVVANYSGDSNYLPAQSAPVTFGFRNTASVTLRQVTGGSDATFAFTSATPALNVSLTTSGGTAQTQAIALLPGTYSVTAADMIGAGLTLSSLVCTDANGSVDLAGRTATIQLDIAESVVCTFSAANSAAETQQYVEKLIETRAAVLLANQPNLSRRIARFNATASAGNPVDSLMGYLPQLMGGGQQKVQASLAAIEAAAGNAQPNQFDVWIDATFGLLQANGVKGNSTVATVGADYLLTPDFLVGGFVQFDAMSQRSDVGVATADTSGFMAGPYVTAKLNEQLYLDLLAGFGSATNRVSPLGTYSDTFNSSRYLLSATLSGQIEWDQWTFMPRAQLSYFEETAPGYTDGLGIDVPGSTVGMGQIAVGPGISYRFVSDGQITVDTGLRLDAVLNLTDIANLGANQPYGRVETNLTLGFGGGATLGLSASYDGLGASSQQSVSASGNLRIPVR